MKQLSRDLIFGVLLTSLTLIFAAKTAKAQDPVEVSPTVYKTLLENDHVRVLEMRVKADQKDKMHSHPSEVVHFIKGGKVRINLPDGEAPELEIPDGHVMWHDGWTHMVENIGTSEIYAIIVEVKTPQKIEKPKD